MSVTDQIKAQLAPALQTLVAKLSEREEPVSELFFRNLASMLDRAQSEEDLILFSMELSTCAFVGLDYGMQSASDIDGFLALAEGISHTMSVGPDTPH